MYVNKIYKAHKINQYSFCKKATNSYPIDITPPIAINSFITILIISTPVYL